MIGCRWESPALLPNRTRAAIIDLETLVDRIEKKLGNKICDSEIFLICVSEFRLSFFSENLKSVSFESGNDVVDVFTTIILLSMTNSVHDTTVLVSLLYLIAGSQTISMSISQMDNLTRILENRPFLHSLISKLSFNIKHRLCQYIDHSGCISVRDNCEDAFGKFLSSGVSTGRSVRVVLNENEVCLSNMNDEIIFNLGQTRHNSVLNQESRLILSELSNIIPPPCEESDGNLSDEQLAVLPSDSVKFFLKDGRLKNKRRKSKTV